MEACRAAGIGSDRLRLGPWGVRVRTLDASEAEDIRRRHGIQRPYVLFCGTREPRKNLPRVLEAFDRIDRYELELVLAGPPSLTASARTPFASSVVVEAPGPLGPVVSARGSVGV